MERARVTAPSPKNATATCRLPRKLCRRRPHRDRTPAATIPFAEDPEAPGRRCASAAATARAVPPSLANSSANISSGVDTLGQAVPVTAVRRRDDVGGAAASTPTAAPSCPIDRCTEAGHLAVAVERSDPLLEPADQQHPAMAMEKVGDARSARAHYVLVGTTSACWPPRRDAAEQIEIPDSFPSGGDVTDKRVVITGAGGARSVARARVLAQRCRALVAQAERSSKTVAQELPGPAIVCSAGRHGAEFNEAVADATVAEWGGVDVWICNAGISPVVGGPRKTDPSRRERRST